MTRRQQADDPALGMRAVWLGPKGLRWPFDATFAQWQVAAVLSLVAAVVMIVVLPALVPMLALAWACSAIPVRRLDLTRPRLTVAAMVAGWAAFLALAVPSVAAWLSPMPVVLGALLAPVVGALITWRVGHYLTSQRPAAYWLSMLPRASRGPRSAQEIEYRTDALAIVARAADEHEEA